MMHFYHMAFERVMEMPYRRFVFMNRCIDRIGAEQDIRTLRVLAAVTSSETYVSELEALEKRVGEIVTFKRALVTATTLEIETIDPAFDREGLDELRSMLKS